MDILRMLVYLKTEEGVCVNPIKARNIIDTCDLLRQLPNENEYIGIVDTLKNYGLSKYKFPAKDKYEEMTYDLFFQIYSLMEKEGQTSQQAGKCFLLWLLF